MAMTIEELIRLEELIEMAEDENLSYLLGDMVMDHKIDEANDINISGPTEQITYLVESGVSLTEIEKLLSETEE